MSTVAIDLEVLVTEVQAVCTEIAGMKWENEWRKIQGEALAYGEEMFQMKAEELRVLGKKIGRLRTHYSTRSHPDP